MRHCNIQRSDALCFLGESDIGEGSGAIIQAAIGLGVLNLSMAYVVYRVLQSGWKLKD